MAFKRVSLNDDTVSKSFRNQIVAAATYEPARSVSNSRLLGSGLSILFGLFILYTSVFYVPAFVNMGALGLATPATEQPQADTKKHLLSGYTDMFKIRRGYIRAGQSLHVDYALSPGQNLMLNIQKCSAPVILEVFYCSNIQGQEIKVTGDARGSRSFVMREPGFYYFDEVVTNGNGSISEDPFFIMWSRKD